MLQFNNQGEPECFSINGGNFGGVVSDCYSFLDQDADELSAKGNGGFKMKFTTMLL